MTMSVQQWSGPDRTGGKEPFADVIGGPGLLGRPWPELMPDHRPALVLPAGPGL
ncbi:hypothetical protein ACIRPK_35920 [Kitasatospora sp. NPDC101801]|uniref:hypothetical protein n=1 Tax=Kitasatospora sp. NPDC101801 TaxID=3364103 RepID=UPI003825008A